MFHKGKHDREKQLRFSIRKVSFGAASVAVAALFMFLGNGAVSATEQGVPSTNGETQAPQPKDQNVQNGTYEGNTVAISPAATVETNTQPSTVENNPSPESSPQKVETLDRKELTDLIKEIDGKFAKGTYATKTEESVNNLRTVLEEARTVLNNAKTQAELSQAQAKLVTATTKLQTKPEEKKEAPAVDTTNGKDTVGVKATNTEKAADTNSIANSGSRDERNGKALDKNNPFRTGTTPSTTDDTSATQVFDNPAEGADVKTLSNKLKSLPETIQNNEKIQDMNELGNAKRVAKGQVLEIDEFGGWKAINQPDGTAGKFAIARKTESGVFPIETVNTVYNDRAKSYDTYVKEQAFDRSKDYMLFLGKVRTRASQSEKTFNGRDYQSTGLGASDSFAIKKFSGIEKTFKAYSPETGSKVKVAFKTGYTGDLNGTKAKYLVEVVYHQKGSEVNAYKYTFEPQPKGGTLKNDHGIVTSAKDGTGTEYLRSKFNNHNLNKDEVEAKMAEEANKPNGQAGMFTSSDIDLPVGVTEYTVRIKVTETERMGMGYQSPLRHYALPVTGTDFSIEQDTKNIAKDLLQRIYNRLVEQKSEDTKWSTPETKAAYETKLTEINNLLSSETSTTSKYKESAELLIEKYKSLNNRDEIVAAAKADLAQAVEAEKNEINADNSLTSAAKAEKVKAVEAKKTEEEAKIAAAENADKVADAKTAGEAAVKAVHDNGDLEANKEKALEAIQTASESKIASIDKNAKLSDDEKAAAKAEVAQAAIAAVNAINEAKDQAGVDSAQTTGVKAINAVTPVGKEKALEAIQTASEAKIASIDKNAKLSDDEKAAAKAEVAQAAIAAVNAINEAKDQDGVDAAQTTGVKAIEAVNPVGTSSTNSAGNGITPPTVEVPAYTEPVGTSSTDGEGNVIIPPTAEVPAYTDPVGTSSTDGSGNVITPPTVEIPAYTDPVGTSSADGSGNVITPPTLEVPAYTDPVGTSSTDGDGNVITPPTVEVPAYTDPVGTSSTDGEGNVITPPTVEVPAYTDPVGTSNTDGDGNVITPPTVEVPAYTDPVGTSSTDGAGNVITPPTAEVPAYTEPVGTSSTAGDGNVVTPPTAEVPAYTGSVNGISEEMPAQPHKDGSANEMSDGTPVSETTINKDRQLPNTGTADSTVAMVAAAASAVLGLGLAGRRRKEDEEV